MNKKQLTYRGFTGTVEWSEDDRCFHGKLIGVPDLVLYSGDSEAELRSCFVTAVKEYIEDGRPIRATSHPTQKRHLVPA